MQVRELASHKKRTDLRRLERMPTKSAPLRRWVTRAQSPLSAAMTSARCVRGSPRSIVVRIDILSCRPQDEDVGASVAAD